jgi:hypothetical protein
MQTGFETYDCSFCQMGRLELLNDFFALRVVAYKTKPEVYEAEKDKGEAKNVRGYVWGADYVTFMSLRFFPLVSIPPHLQ